MAAVWSRKNRGNGLWVGQSLEFLEHVEKELDVLARIPAGTKIIATVPNFPYVSHVRHFDNVDQVRERYGSYFESLTVDAIRKNAKGRILFLMEGIKN